jgi:hypothetical protein
MSFSTIPVRGNGSPITYAWFNALRDAGILADTAVSDHIADSSGAHAASAISNTPSGNLAASTVQAALNELQADIDTRATSSALTTHTGASSGVHGITGSVVGTTDTQTLSGKTLSSATLSGTTTLPGSGQLSSGGNLGLGITPTSKLQVLGDITIGATSGVGNVLYFKSTTGTQSIGNLNHAGKLQFSASSTTPQLTLLSGGNFGIGTTDPGAKLEVDGDLRISTTSSASAAASGNQGEYKEVSVTTGTNFPTSTNLGDLGSLTLETGTWQVTLIVTAATNGATMSSWRTGIGTASGNSATGLSSGINYLYGELPNSSHDSSVTVPSWKVQVSGASSTVYGKVRADYSAGTPQFRGVMFAWRLR